MNKKGFELGFSIIGVILLMLVVVIAVLIAFNTQFRGTFKQIVGIGESVSNFSLPSLGLEEKKPVELSNDDKCLREFRKAGEYIAAIKGDRLVLIKEEIKLYEDFLKYEPAVGIKCASDLLTKSQDKLKTLKNELFGLHKTTAKQFIQEKRYDQALETLNKAKTLAVSLGITDPEIDKLISEVQPLARRLPAT